MYGGRARSYNAVEGVTAVNELNVIPEPLDAVVVGAGFSGLYMLHRLRQAGFSARSSTRPATSAGPGTGTAIPGARCDIPTTDYTYSFDPELEKAWTWSEEVRHPAGNP
jgi:cation diffusion facilitator CzcD-associated flavoprotein CzcO